MPFAKEAERGVAVHVLPDAVYADDVAVVGDMDFCGGGWHLFVLVLVGVLLAMIAFIEEKLVLTFTVVVACFGFTVMKDGFFWF